MRMRTTFLRTFVSPVWLFFQPHLHSLFKAVLSNQSVFHCLCIDSDGYAHILGGLQLKCSLCWWQYPLSMSFQTRLFAGRCRNARLSDLAATSCHVWVLYFLLCPEMLVLCATNSKYFVNWSGQAGKTLYWKHKYILFYFPSSNVTLVSDE